MTQSVDFIVYEADTSKPHQDHIIAHELAHMVCGHRSGAGADVDNETARLLFPDLDPGLLRKILGRTSYSTVQEREAEVTASLILERINRPVLEPISAVPSEDAGAVERIERSLRRRGSEDRPSGNRDGSERRTTEATPGATPETEGSEAAEAAPGAETP
ncbi:ImmA/IrrE family metallo-endopeptidase [Streptomyces winkii]|uniref:ImmA/IrrE family metallo-endopeptidase n=1 Tax=Streptomyces winkii TaxID=3051178 RepID=UPI0028D7E03C|nr:ParH-like protein [Streptomyces sp. DSM 40971]